MKTLVLLTGFVLTAFGVAGCGSGLHAPGTDSASSTLVVSAAVAPAVDGLPYTSALPASGGSSHYTWSVVSGLLPSGLQLASATGVISGTPTATGTSNFTVSVVDSSTTQSTSAPVALTVLPRLSVGSTNLPATVAGRVYAGQIVLTGGTAPYQWSVKSGQLPAGITMTAGLFSGAATAAGVFSFTLSATDSANPAQVISLPLSIQVTTPTLTVDTLTLPVGQSGASYSTDLQAKGGTPPYQWSVLSGSLPQGMTLSATGAITGTPSQSGTSSFSVAVSDRGGLRAVPAAPLSLTVVAAQNPGTTWYVRPDGGTRYSSRMQSGQCDGKSDSPYSGKGVNQHCAFGDVRFFWQDGSYTSYNNQASFPAYGWVGSGGDTYIIRGSIGTGVSWRVGWPNAQGTQDPATGIDYGVAGDPYGSGAPAPLSGTAGQHTRILGENYASCHTASAKTQLHGGFGVSTVLDLTGTSYVDVSCLDITDFDSCGRAAQTNSCNSQVGQLSDYASNGIRLSRNTTHDTLNDVHIHGLASAGLVGPTGDGVVMSYVDVIGNAGAGWNADLGDGTTGTGSLLVQNFNISWNGCAEEYPISHALPYQDCTDDNAGGYGDGFGTATVASSPGWNVTFDHGTASYNTQDGLDALHLIGAGSSMTISRTEAFGNMGQQIKVGGAAGSAVNNIITTNCNALREAIPGTPFGYNSRLSDFCRAADTGVVLTLGRNAQLTFDFNTIYSASSTAIEIDCDTTNGQCNNTSKIDFRNNVFVGFVNNRSNGYPNGGTGDYSSPIYNGVGFDFFAVQGSLYSNNVTYHAKSNWSCPAPHEQNGVCMDPQLADETWHNYGDANMAPLATSAAVMSAAAIPAITIDYAGLERGSPPTRGALEK